MIGIFDSGIGGLTVAHAIEQILPRHSLVYFGDIARTPYGSKSRKTLIHYSLENTEFLVKKGAKIIVIGCNSAASVAAGEIRKTFNIPVFEVITPAAEQAVAADRNGRTGIIGTRATISSRAYDRAIKKLKPDIRVFSQPCPLLVPLVEEGWINKRETKMILRRYLHSLKNRQLDTLILGCTHYPLLRHLIQPRIGKKVTLIDSSTALATQLKNYLEEQPELDMDTNENRSYYFSDLTETSMQTAASLFQKNINLQLARIDHA
ncbi:glutamate racemase [Desulfomarina sp.]